MFWFQHSICYVYRKIIFIVLEIADDSVVPSLHLYVSNCV